MDNDGGVTCEFMYEGVLHTATICPHVHIFDEAAGKIDAILRELKRKLLIPKEPKVDIDHVKKCLKNTDKTGEDFLRELKKLERQVNDKPCVEFIEITILSMKAKTSWDEEEGKEKIEEELLKKIIGRWNSSKKKYQSSYPRYWMRWRSQPHLILQPMFGY